MSDWPAPTKMPAITPKPTILDHALDQGDGTDTILFYPSKDGIDISNYRQFMLAVDLESSVTVRLFLELSISDAKDFLGLSNPTAPDTEINVFAATTTITKKFFPLNRTIGANALGFEQVIGKRLRFRVELGGSANTGDKLSMALLGA